MYVYDINIILYNIIIRLRLRIRAWIRAAAAVIYYVLITTRRKTRFSDDPIEPVPTVCAALYVPSKSMCFAKTGQTGRRQQRCRRRRRRGVTNVTIPATAHSSIVNNNNNNMRYPVVVIISSSTTGMHRMIIIFVPWRTYLPPLNIILLYVI